MPQDFDYDQVTVEVAIESTRLTPEQITQIVGVPCDECRYVGDQRGKTGKTWDRNIWWLRNRKRTADNPGKSAHDLLPICMAEFFERLSTIREGLRQAVQSEGGQFGITTTCTFVPGLSFDQKIITEIADLGLSLDIDVILYGSD